MVAVQGPGAVDVVAAVTDIDVATMGYYRCETGIVLGHPARVSRTGYTGEDGFGNWASATGPRIRQPALDSETPGWIWKPARIRQLPGFGNWSTWLDLETGN